MASYIGNLSVFDHNVQEWPIFKGRLEQYIKLNKVAADSTGALLITHLSDDTYRLTRDLLHPNKIDAAKFDELVAALDKHFTPQQCLLADREKFFEARRAVGESIEQWAVRVRGLAVHCGFGGSLDEQLRDRFALGLNPGPERDRLFEQDAAKLTFAKALEVARQAACARQARENAAGSASLVKVKEEAVYRVGHARATAGTGGARPPAPDQQVPRCAVCGLKYHDAEKCRYKTYRCQICGEKGHLKKVCRGKKSSQARVHNLCPEVQASDGNECEGCHECELFNMRYVSYSPIVINVTIMGIKLKMELDSGSGTTVISDQIYNTQFKHLKLNESDLRMCLYTGHKISPMGYFTSKVSYLNESHDLKIYVVKNGGPPLLGRDFMAKFGLYFTSNNNHLGMDSLCPGEVLQLLDNYSDLFSDELGKFNKFEIELRLKENAVPKFFKPRSIPFALKDRVEEEIQRLLDVGILQPVTYSKYATPIVPVLKEDGKVKIAGDFSQTLNKDLEIEKYPMPRIEEVFSKLGGGEKYTKIDLSNAYNQFVLSESSQELTTISTPKGLYKYTRLVYGLANAPAIFQRSMETLLAGIEGVSCWLDDVCITGPTKAMHLARLKEVLSRLRDAGLKLHKGKCKFFQDAVTYLGYVISKDGLRTCPKKVEAIINAPRPENVLGLKRFLGMINYYRNFLPNASGKLHPLHDLLRAEAVWEWGERQERAFVSIKEELSSDRVLAHFDPDAQLVLTVDAGPAGLGAVLAQIDADGRERPLAFASRSLTPSERNYSQIQKEATAIVFGVKHFHQYLYGQQVPFILKTDHRPLLSIFGKKVGISIMAASRLQRYALILSAYNFSVQYISSDNNVVADYFSRAPVESKITEDHDSDTSYLKFLDSNVAPITLENIKKATSEDSTLNTVINYMNHGWPRKINCQYIAPYFHCKAELEGENGCLFRGLRVVIPTIYRSRLLKELHAGHLGVVKSKGLARSRFWWPGIDKDIEQWVGSCATCISVRSAPPRAAPAPWPAETEPWTRLHIDYFTIANKTFLVVIDAFSKWPECLIMNEGTSTRALIRKLKELFSRYGLPRVIVSDNDVKIRSQEFEIFCSTNGIRYITSPIYHPSSNGQAENTVKICKNMIRRILEETNSFELLKEKLMGFLFEYRNSPHCHTGVSPAKLMFGHDLRCRLDISKPSTSDDVNTGTPPCNRHFNIGDNVWLRWFVNRKEVWTLGKVINLVGKRMYEVYAVDYGVTCKRHIDQLTRYTDVNGAGRTDEVMDNVSEREPSIIIPTDASSNTVSPTESCVRENVEEDEWEEAQQELCGEPEGSEASVPGTSASVVNPAGSSVHADQPSRPHNPRPLRSCRLKKVNYKE